MKAWKRIGLGAALAAAAMMWAGCGGQVTISPNTSTGSVIVTGVRMVDLDAYKVGLPGKGHLWVDGVEQSMDVDYSSLSGVKASGGSVYAAGWKGAIVSNSASTTGVTMSSPVMQLWKDGKTTKLPCAGGGCTGGGVDVSGNDVYVAGQEWSTSDLITQHSKAAYWKNGVENKLSNDGSESDSVGVVVDGADVYLAGSVTRNGVRTATLWKNGTPQYLEGSSIESWAFSLSVSDGAAYVCGVRSDGPRCWKASGSTVTVVEDTTVTYAWLEQLRVVNGKRYLVGSYLDTTTDARHARLWVDDVAQTLEGADASESLAYDVTVHGSDVYVVGYVINAATKKTQAALWKNGKLTLLSDGSNYDLAMAVIVRD